MSTPYRTTGDVAAERMAWRDKAAHLVRVARWWALASVLGALCGGAIKLAAVACAEVYARMTAPAPCFESATLLNAASSTQAVCDHRATLTVTQVATGQLARCVCHR